MAKKIKTNSSRKLQSDSNLPHDFYNTRDLTRFGPASVPGYSMVPNKVIPRQRDSWFTPGPGTYCPECYNTTSTPAFSLAGRIYPRLNIKSDRCMDTPGPGAYYPEHYEQIGARTPAFTLGARLLTPTDKKPDFPAPNAYQEDTCPYNDKFWNPDKGKTFGNPWNTSLNYVTSNVPFYSLTNLNAYKRRTATYKMAPSVNQSVGFGHPSTPGPLDYFPQPGRNTPAFSFGTKYSSNVSTMRTSSEYKLIC